MTEHPLKRPALLLRNAAPDEWENFLHEFEQFTGLVTVAVTEAGADTIMTAAGNAQMVRSLLRVFKECNIERAKPQPDPTAQP